LHPVAALGQALGERFVAESKFASKGDGKVLRRRLAGLVVATLASYAVMITTATAIPAPSFSTTAVSFKISEPVVIEGAGFPKISCTTNKGSGKIVATNEVDGGGFLEHCTSASSCPETIGYEYTGQLGLIFTEGKSKKETEENEEKAEVGILIKWSSGGFECNGKPASILGTVAGTVSPVGTLTTSYKWTFAVHSGVQQVRSIVVGHTRLTPELKGEYLGSSHLLTLESNAAVAFASSVEVKR
jgi:hypothetical protein